jgi:CBS domain-containing protein
MFDLGGLRRCSVASRTEISISLGSSRVATVRDYMDPDPVTVRPDTSLEEVARVLGENELHGVPVTTDDGRVVGIVTENDLVIGDDEGDLHIPAYIELFGGLVFLGRFQRFEERMKKAVASNAEQMMSADPRTVGPDDDLDDAAHVMVETGHNRIPVVDGGRLVGVVSRADVVRALAAGQ